MALVAWVPISIATYDADLARDAKFSDVIVLGAAIYGDRPSPVFAARLDYANGLLRAGRAGEAIITGGLGEGEARSEAEVGRNYLIARGISEAQVLVEVVSRTTFENLCNAKHVLQPQPGQRYAVVSDPLHLRRAMLLAADAGLDVIPAATPYTRYRSLGARAKFLLRESYFYAQRLLAGPRTCVAPEGGVAALTGWRHPDPKDVAVVDADTTRGKLERLVWIAGQERSELALVRSGRAYSQLRALAEQGFDDFVACANDRRPVWSHLTMQIAEPTALGHICVDLITEHIDALYRTKGGLGIVTAQNAQAWWSERKGKTLAELQIDTLEAYRAQVAERKAAEAAAGARYFGTELSELDERLQRARKELAQGVPLTLDR